MTLERKDKAWLTVTSSGWTQRYTIRRSRGGGYCRRCGASIEDGDDYAVLDFSGPYDKVRCLPCAEATLDRVLVEGEDY